MNDHQVAEDVHRWWGREPSGQLQHHAWARIADPGLPARIRFLAVNIRWQMIHGAPW